MCNYLVVGKMEDMLKDSTLRFSFNFHCFRWPFKSACSCLKGEGRGGGAQHMHLFVCVWAGKLTHIISSNLGWSSKLNLKYVEKWKQTELGWCPRPLSPSWMRGKWKKKNPTVLNLVAADLVIIIIIIMKNFNRHSFHGYQWRNMHTPMDSHT